MSKLDLARLIAYTAILFYSKDTQLATEFADEEFSTRREVLDWIKGKRHQYSQLRKNDQWSVMTFLYWFFDPSSRPLIVTEKKNEERFCQISHLLKAMFINMAQDGLIQNERVTKKFLEKTYSLYMKYMNSHVHKGAVILRKINC